MGNPARKIKLPTIVEPEMHFLTEAQVDHLAGTIAQPYGLLILFAAYTGLRLGELTAVKIKRLDLLRGKLIWGPTKTYAKRTVHLPGFLRVAVGAYLADRPHGPDDVLFTMPQGGTLRESKFMEQIFKPAARAAGLAHDLRMHDLRHTAASLMIREAGGSIKAVQKALGHKSGMVTLDRYGHLWPDELEGLAEALDRAYERAQIRVETGHRRDRDGAEVLQIHKTAGQGPAV